MRTRALGVTRFEEISTGNRCVICFLGYIRFSLRAKELPIYALLISERRSSLSYDLSNEEA